ncbi:MAG: adenylate/guanylate cyclase domain-containing protein [Candidatus Roizmanbacteria bacterium]
MLNSTPLIQITESKLETKVLSVMFTDMKGFTNRTSGQSRQEIEDLLSVHDKIMRPIFTKYGGRIIKTIGDAFLVVFESPTDAVLCGIKIQTTVEHHNSRSNKADQFIVRVAINSGEVHIKDNDVFGEPVNIAARVEGVADGGEVALTESVFLAMNKNEIKTMSMGIHELKGIPYPIKIYRALIHPGDENKYKKIDEENLKKSTEKSPAKNNIFSKKTLPPTHSQKEHPPVMSQKRAPPMKYKEKPLVYTVVHTHRFSSISNFLFIIILGGIAYSLYLWVESVQPGTLYNFYIYAENYLMFVINSILTNLFPN